MSPIEEGDNGLFLQSPDAILQKDSVIIMSPTFSETSGPKRINNVKKGQSGGSSKSVLEKNEASINIDSKLKKIIHRDIERKRRQEMADLCSSLRNLLPLEYIKGKRSTSDHMLEAVKYIKHKERSINNLKMQRDKYLTDYNSFNNIIGSSSSINNVKKPKLVMVNTCPNGIEITISCGNEGLCLSMVLMELLEIGLINVISCITSKANEEFLYRIQCEICDLTYIDLPRLQQRLADLINFIS